MASSRSSSSCWFEALILSIGSSFDNLAVGVSLGLHHQNHSAQQKQKKQQYNLHRLNSVISICNALGALFSSYVSQIAFLGGSSLAPTALAGVLFAWLALSEAREYYQHYSANSNNPPNENDSNKNITAITGSLSITSLALQDDHIHMWKLALPMTLNNLAGGIAGGLAGVNAIYMFISAFAASYGLMWCGYYFVNYIFGKDKKSKPLLKRYLHPSLISGIIFSYMALNQLTDYLNIVVK